MIYLRVKEKKLLAGDRWRLTGDIWQVTFDRWQVTGCSVSLNAVSRAGGYKLFKLSSNRPGDRPGLIEGGGLRELFDLSFRPATIKKTLDKKYTVTRSNQFSKIQWKIHILTFLNIDWNSSKQKKIRQEIWTFSFQICFRNQFLTLGSGLTKVKNLFRKQIWNENVYISILYFCIEFWITFKKNQNMDFLLNFQKVIWPG